jgi:HAD superfamily hydrolase (TIGR01549 family)
MQRLAQEIEAVVFDYGNTLIEFGPRQVETCDRELSAALHDMFGPHDFDQLTAIQHEERRSPYQGEFVEHDLAAITASLVRKLYETDPTEDQVAELLEVRFRAMTGCVRVDPQVHDLLERLRERFQLGLVSNYPCSRSIRHSLAEHGLDQWFGSIVVSGDVGHVKPHPRLFECVVSELNVSADAVLFVGDNWLGDIQGALRFGMKAAWIQQYTAYEKFDREPDHGDAHLELQHLSELSGLLS